jgi:hypothetical protein
MPHPLRAKAGSRSVYSVPIIIFIDDVSGNKSKQWNKHYACYMSNGSLPREKLSEEFHVRFVAASPNATPLEIMQGVRTLTEFVSGFSLCFVIDTDTISGSRSNSDAHIPNPSSPGIAKRRKKFYYKSTPSSLQATIRCKPNCAAAQDLPQITSVERAVSAAPRSTNDRKRDFQNYSR